MDNLDKKSIVELQKLESEKQLALRDIRFGTAAGKNKNVKEVSVLKKDIARIKTAIKKMVVNK